MPKRTRKVLIRLIFPDVAVYAPKTITLFNFCLFISIPKLYYMQTVQNILNIVRDVRYMLIHDCFDSLNTCFESLHTSTTDRKEGDRYPKLRKASSSDFLTKHLHFIHKQKKKFKLLRSTLQYCFLYMGD